MREIRTYGSGRQEAAGRLSSDVAGPAWRRLTYALNAVAQQHDAWASRLYWYTDLEAAKAAAKDSGKPILSLRLLGKLNEELSCANSRFFRTALYPNAELSSYLRDHFVLHWQSERPVPKITIDFGDGRKLERTLTGNSIHYILDPSGHPIDAVPGLYGPGAFMRQLKEAEAAAKDFDAQPEGERDLWLRKYHQAKLDASSQAWTADIAKSGVGNFPPRLLDELTLDERSVSFSPRPSARQAGVLAFTKVAVQAPLVNAVTPDNAWALGASAPDEAWSRMGQIYAADSRLDEAGMEVMASQNPHAAAPVSPVAPPPLWRLRLPPSFFAGFKGSGVLPGLSPLQRVAASFERSMAQDSARNEYIFHSRLHQWFASGASTADFETLNRAVYAKLFLTPRSDPWLGLSTNGVYTALSNDGMTSGQ